MGNTYEVYNWEQCGTGRADVLRYGGDDKEEALAKMEELKSNGASSKNAISDAPGFRHGVEKSPLLSVKCLEI